MTRGILHADETLCTATDDRLAIAVWHGEPTVPHMDLLEDMVRERVRLFSKAILMVIVERAVLPPEAPRARMVEVMDRYKSSLSAIAVVIEVGGMFGTALRAMGRGVVVASRSRTPTLFTNSVEEAAKSLSATPGVADFDAKQVVRTIGEIRKRYTSTIPPASPHAV